MIKQYPNDAAYAAAGLPTSESRVAQITQDNEVKIDGVNVVVPVPGDGDAVFLDANGKERFVRFDTIQKNLIDPAWTHVGYAFGRKGRRFKVLDKAFPTATYQWLGCWQYAITAISATTIKFWLKMKGDYANFVGIEVELTSAEINATSAAEINAALDAAGNTGNVGYANHGYWAFLADANGNKVDSDGTQIIVQCDFNGAYQQYQCSDSTHALVGCTMALSVWGDMPASSALLRKNGTSTYYAGMNFEKFYAYYSVSGATPSANVGIRAVDIVNKTAFETSQYCATLRETYGDYRTYVEQNMLMRPQPAYGVFNLIDADEMTRRYGSATFAKKDGTASWKFPALHSAAGVGYGSGKYAQGRWHLSDIDDEYLRDDVLPKMQEAQRRMGTTIIANNVNRWFARRYNASYAWYFYGTYGTLSNGTVNYALRCQAVTLSDLD